MNGAGRQGAPVTGARNSPHHDEVGPPSRTDSAINHAIYALSAVAVVASFAILFLVAM